MKKSHPACLGMDEALIGSKKKKEAIRLPSVSSAKHKCLGLIDVMRHASSLKSKVHKVYKVKGRRSKTMRV